MPCAALADDVEEVLPLREGVCMAQVPPRRVRQAPDLPGVVASGGWGRLGMGARAEGIAAPQSKTPELFLARAVYLILA